MARTDTVEPPEADRVEGAPHPRDTVTLTGQDAAEAAFLDAHASGRLHHGWLLTGPRGVGKATLAWRIARFLLAEPAATMDGAPEPAPGLLDDIAPPPPAQARSLSLPPDHPVSRRVAAQSEPRLRIIRRGWDDKTKRLRAVITVEEMRALKGFFHLSAADGGHRVVIVDSADEMNTAAANALLKELEEPPAGAVLLLISHQPARLLPTIRSRCRELRLQRLGPEALKQALAAAGAELDPGETAALAALADGSAGEALRLANLGGVALYREITALLAALPRPDRTRTLALADSMAGRGNEARFDLALGLLGQFMARAARTGATGAPPSEAAPGEAALLSRLAPDPAAGRIWADLYQDLGARGRHGAAVNLDPSALLLDMVLRIEEAAARVAAR